MQDEKKMIFVGKATPSAYEANPEAFKVIESNGALVVRPVEDETYYITRSPGFRNGVLNVGVETATVYSGGAIYTRSKNKKATPAGQQRASRKRKRAKFGHKGH